MGTLNINLLGTSFAIKANEDDEYLEKLLGYYTQIVRDIESSGGLADSMQVAIMSGIMLCDELYKEKTKTAQLEDTHQAVMLKRNEEAEKLTLEMIEKIDKALS